VKVVSVHRYPVKSLLGEDLASIELDGRGVAGDRVWSVRTAVGKIGSGKNTRRFAAVPRLLELRAVTNGDGVDIALPNGAVLDIRAAELARRLSEHCGQPLTLASETNTSHFDDGPVSLIGLASVDALSTTRGQPIDRARFRPNIVVDTDMAFAEEQWIGRRVAVGGAVLEVTMASPRCVMIDMATADLPAQPGNLTAIGRLNNACLGVIARVVRPGVVSVGDGVDTLTT
jgi:uncharacterized protein YcbX